MRWLSWRCAVSVRTARYVYAAIGPIIESRGHDVWAGRAPLRAKLLQVARAFALGALEAPTRLVRSTRTEVPSVALRFTDAQVSR